MDAVDLAALGLSSSSGQMPAVSEDEIANGNTNGDRSQTKASKKKRKRRPSSQSDT
jgi:hypothetical protein